MDARSQGSGAGGLAGGPGPWAVGTLMGEGRQGPGHSQPGSHCCHPRSTPSWHDAWRKGREMEMSAETRPASDPDYGGRVPELSASLG